MNSKILLICFLCASVQTFKGCFNQKSCGDCIQFQNCVWLTYDPSNNVMRKTGCYPLSLVQNFNKTLYNPQSSVEVIKNSSLNENIKVSPQAVKLQLRLNTPVDFQILTRSDERLTVPNLNDLNSLNITISFKLDKNNIITTIEALSCPRNQNQTHQTIHLTTTPSHENISLEIELICKCPCENSDQIVVKAPQCSNTGTYQCGHCRCDELTYGDFCECLKEQKLGVCENKEQTCSGRGVCVCNTCHCNLMSNPDELIYGEYCECDNFSCPRVEGQLCNGHDHGICTCGVCQCIPGWSGEDCGNKI